jgi:hypothetical protein
MDEQFNENPGEQEPASKQFSESRIKLNLITALLVALILLVGAVVAHNLLKSGSNPANCSLCSNKFACQFNSSDEKISENHAALPCEKSICIKNCDANDKHNNLAGCPFTQSACPQKQPSCIKKCPGCSNKK